MHKFRNATNGLAVISNLYKDHLMMVGIIVVALHAGSYFFGQ